MCPHIDHVENKNKGFYIVFYLFVFKYLEKYSYI